MGDVMKKMKRYLCIVLAMLTMILTGCGTQLYELTAEEEDLIVHSAAYFVAKHNVQQKDGVNSYPYFENMDEEESESGSESKDTEEIKKPITGNEASKPQEATTSLAALIGHAETLEVTYQGSQVTNSYIEGSAYYVNAASGKAFYVMKFKLTNTSNQDIKVDNASKSPVVKLVSDAVTVKSEVTFLMSDFSTYQGTIKPGESVDTILLFEVSKSLAEQIENPTLEISVDNKINKIKF